VVATTTLVALVRAGVAGGAGNRDDNRILLGPSQQIARKRADGFQMRLRS
jgi:hypothetical protein